MKSLMSFLKTQYINALIRFLIKINEFKKIKPRKDEKKEEKST